MKTTALFVFFVLLNLSGCASVNSYHEPKDTSIATVRGSSTRDGMYDWSSTIVSSIDNKFVGRVWSENSKIKVTPGLHHFVITSSFNRGFSSGGPFISYTDVTATLKPNQNYQFLIEVNGTLVKAWAIDSNGKVSSKVGTSHYQTAPRENIMPMIITDK